MVKTAVFFIASLATWSHPRAAEDDWPRYGRDGALTARSPLKGSIASPRVAWQHSVAGRELSMEALPAEGSRGLELGAAALSSPDAPRSIPRPGPPSRDIDGSGAQHPAAETFHERWAKILPDVKGLQRVAWSHTWTDQKVCRLQLFAYDQGFEKPRLVWQTDPPEDTIFSPLNIVHDIDGDGIQEICVAAHYRIMIFEGTTGRKETELRYHGSRPYGWFGIVDLDADGRAELVTIGDFQSHIDVLAYDPGKPEPERLSVKWRRDIETSIEERSKWPQVGPRPVLDVDGDGKKEIAVNLFNDSGDGQWHLVVLEGITGKVLHDFPRRYLQGSADVDYGGAMEIFVASTEGVLVPTFSRVEILKCCGPSPTVVWSAESARWALADLPFLGPAGSTTAAQGMREALVTAGSAGSAPTFLVLERRSWQGSLRECELKALRIGRETEPEVLWRIEGLPCHPEVTALSTAEGAKSPGAAFRIRIPGNAGVATGSGLTCRGAKPVLVENRPLGVTISTPVAARLRPGSPMAVVVEGPAQSIHAIEPPAASGGSCRVVWRRPGRGMSDGSRFLGPLACDLDGDGGCEVLVADETPSGQALLVACRSDGAPLWQAVFAETPGAPPAWNVGALTFWWAGRFRDPGKLDIFVSTRRGPMHSDIGQLLDGRSGETIWRREKAEVPGEFRWGYGGIAPAVADVNLDGLDEIISLYPVCFWIADGRTGKITAGKELASQKALPAWAAYGEPMVRDFSGRGKPEVLLDSPYILALLDLEGKPVWHGPGRMSYPTKPGEGNVGETTQVRHALADLDGDGTFEVASAGYASGFRAVDPRSGKVLWSLAAPAPTCPRVVAANIDGRGGDEILYPAGSTLVAITGSREGGSILWEWQGPAALSMPAIADMDGDSLAEIILQDADGTVHCIDS